jgi:hypothetical protein
MVYQPKPWPVVANRHRVEAILKAGEIRKEAAQARDNVYQNPDLAINQLRLIEAWARMIVDTLEAAPGPLGDDDDE